MFKILTNKPYPPKYQPFEKATFRTITLNNLQSLKVGEISLCIVDIGHESISSENLSKI